MNNTNLLKTGFVNERFRYYEKLVAELTMMSDMFMRNVLNILECAEYVLRVITENEIDDLIIKFVKKHFYSVDINIDYKALQGNLQGFFRIRKGNIRIIIQVVDNEIIIEVIIEDIGFRGDIYK